MKKILIAIVAVLAISIPAKAQLRYGATAGVDITSLNFSQDLFGVDSAVGYQAGVQAELMFPGIGFGIDFGLMYTQRGATLHLEEQPIWATEGYNATRSYLHYIDIPINLRFKWTRLNGIEEKIAPYVFGGPILSILAGHNKVDAFEYPGGNFSLQAGLGFELFRRWQIQGSYIWDMSYSMKAYKLGNFTGRDRTWSIRLTYLF